MKQLNLLLLALMPFMLGVAQSVEWNKKYYVDAYDAAVHTNNDIFVVGSFYGTQTFGIGHSISVGPGQGTVYTDGYLLKMDNAGNTKWVKTIATDTRYGDAIHIEVKGNSLYIASQDENSSSDYYALVEKYDTAGNRIWAKTISNLDSYWVMDMYVDDTENVYLMYSQWQNTYLRKYDSNGNVLYTHTLFSAYADNAEDLAVDAAGNIFITGHFSTGTGRALMVAKFRPDGTNVFKHTYGGMINYNYVTFGYKMAIDDTANVYITGWFKSSVTIDGNTLTSPDFRQRGFVAKFDSLGINQWATMINDFTDVNTGAGTGYGGLDIRLSNDGSKLYSVYANTFRTYSFTGVVQNSFVLNGSRYFGLSEAPDASIYLAGDSVFTYGIITKIGCGAPAINLPATIDTIIGSTLNLTVAGAGYTVNWYNASGTLLAGNTATFNVTVNGDTTIRVDVASAGGCTASKTITIHGICYINKTTPQTICEGTSYQGHNLSGTYRDTVSGVAGCDTIRILQLTVLDTVHTTITATICAGESLGGHSTNGTFTDVLQRANGCDSVRTLVLTVLPNKARTIDTTICFGQTYLGYSTNGTYRDTLLASNGCDSVRTLNLTIRQKNTAVVNKTICQGDSYLGYTTAGSYVDQYTDQYGCDSTHALNLTVTSTIRTTVNNTVCFGDSYLGYTATGAYADTFVSSTGCDSIRTLNLVVRAENATAIARSICQGNSFEGYTVSGAYTDVFTDQYGCDSTRTLNLTVTSTITTLVDAAICDGQSFEGYDATGTYTDIYTSVGGCDSVRTLNLTINNLPIVSLGADTTICQDSTLLLSAGAGFANYNWGSGETTETLIAGAGTFTVGVMDTNGCEGSDTIEITSTVCVGIAELSLNEVSVYPNPFEQVITIKNTTDQFAVYILTDLLGKQIQSGTVASGNQTIQLNGLSSGTYLLTIQVGGSARVFKLNHQ